MEQRTLLLSACTLYSILKSQYNRVICRQLSVGRLYTFSWCCVVKWFVPDGQLCTTPTAPSSQHSVCSTAAYSRPTISSKLDSSVYSTVYAARYGLQCSLQYSQQHHWKKVSNFETFLKINGINGSPFIQEGNFHDIFGR